MISDRRFLSWILVLIFVGATSAILDARAINYECYYNPARNSIQICDALRLLHAGPFVLLLGFPTLFIFLVLCAMDKI